MKQGSCSCGSYVDDKQQAPDYEHVCLLATFVPLYCFSYHLNELVVPVFADHHKPDISIHVIYGLQTQIYSSRQMNISGIAVPRQKNTVI